MNWIFLAGAILSEVSATLSLKLASAGRNRWYPVVVLGYIASFVFLTGALRGGLPLGVAYGIWSATGVALAAVLSHLLFKEPLTRLMGLGMVLIMGGVLLIELGSAH